MFRMLYNQLCSTSNQQPDPVGSALLASTATPARPAHDQTLDASTSILVCDCAAMQFFMHNKPAQDTTRVTRDETTILRDIKTSFDERIKEMVSHQKLIEADLEVINFPLFRYVVLTFDTASARRSQGRKV